MSPCACDACSDDATDSGGMCDFCSLHCFPWETIAGKPRRTARPLAERVRVHAASLFADGVYETRQRVADAAVRAVAPLVETGGRTLLELIRKRLAGRDPPR